METWVRQRDCVLCFVIWQRTPYLGCTPTKHCKVYIRWAQYNTNRQDMSFYFLYCRLRMLTWSLPVGFQWLSPDVVISCAKDRFFMRHEIVGAYQPIELLRKNGIGWNIHGDLVFSIDKSTGDSFVDEMLVNSLWPRHPKLSSDCVTWNFQFNPWTFQYHCQEAAPSANNNRRRASEFISVPFTRAFSIRS